MSAPIHFAVLGPLRASRDGESIALGSPKQRAVLALLLIHANRALTTDQMIEALWGDRPPASAIGTLQAYISNLRRALEPERTRRDPLSVLPKNGAGYQIAVAQEHLDSIRFSHLVAEATSLVSTEPRRGLALIDEALDLWRGNALADFRYEDFAQAEIVRLEELRLAALEARAGALITVGEAQTAIPELENLVSANPLREKLWEYLMVALYRSGRQAEALRGFRRCEEILGEMGIVPAQALRDLEQSILEQDPDLHAAANGAELPSRSTTPAIVGRDAELTLFRSSLEEARSGRASLILLEGEPGIGKTRLMEAFDELAKQAGMRTALARCVEVGGTPPFWPWMQISRRLGSGDLARAAGDRARQLTPLLGGALDAPPLSHLFQLAEGLGLALGCMSESRPVVILIDDLYSADPDSLHLLTLLIAEIQDRSVVIVASHRGPDARPAHPLNRFLTEVLRFDRVHRLVVRPFTLPEVGDLASSMSKGALAPEVIEAIFERTEGNAFYSREVLRLLLDEDATDRGTLGAALPGSVLEVVARRMANLSEGALGLIRQAALFGRTFDARIVREVLGIDLDTSLRVLDEIVATGLLSETATPGFYRFSHMIVVEAITHPLGALRRAQMHADIADRLEALDDGQARWIDIAHHRVRAVPINGRRDAITALTRAAEHACMANAIELAEELFSQRHQLVLDEPRTPQRDRLEIESLFDLGRVWTWNEGFHSPRLEAASKRLWDLTGIATGDARFDPNTPITPMDPVLASFQARFSVEIVSGNVDAAWETAERLLALAAATPDPMVVYAANQTALTTLVHMGDVEAALQAAENARSALITLNPAHDNALMLPLAQQPAWPTYHSFAAWAQWLAGHTQQAEQEMRAARELCEVSGNPFVAGFCTTIEGIVAAMSGDPERVIEAQSWRSCVSPDPNFGVVDDWLRLQATWARGMLNGDPVAAAHDMEAMLGQLQRSNATVSHSLYWGLASELAHCGRQHDLALEFARRGVNHATATGERFWYPELERLIAQSLGLSGQREQMLEALARSRTAAKSLGIAALVERMAIPQG